MTLTAASDKQALREKAADAALAEPPVKWVEKGEGGWGHWTTQIAETERTSCQDAVQISHRQSSSLRRPQSAPPSSSASRAQKIQEHRRGGSARPGKTKVGGRGIPPIFSEHDDEDNVDAADSTWVEDAAADAVGWSERAEWKREQKKWSRLARDALRSMERDEEMTDLALIMRQMEHDPAAAATILGEAAVAAADAALAASESSSSEGSSVAALQETVRKSSKHDKPTSVRALGGQQRRGWRQYLAEKRTRRSRGRPRHLISKGGTDELGKDGEDEEEEAEAGADDLADYYDWLLSTQQAAERARTK